MKRSMMAELIALKLEKFCEPKRAATGDFYFNLANIVLSTCEQHGMLPPIRRNKFWVDAEGKKISWVHMWDSDEEKM